MKQILFYCFILLTMPAISQVETVALRARDFTNISLKSQVADAMPKIYLNGITIIDSRNDTNNIGYSPERNVNQYQFTKGFIPELTEWLSSYLYVSKKNSYGHQLLINIKKLRVSDDAVSKVMYNTEEGQQKSGWLRGVIIKVEYFLQEGNQFMPLYRFDSIIPFKGHPDFDADNFFAISFKLSLEKLFEIEPAKVLSSAKRISLSDIERVNKQGHNLPVYINTTLIKGVYKTFEDFKMSKVTWTDFELRGGPMGDVLYIKENGKEYSTRLPWGICDGENFYINSGDKFSKLIKAGYDFYFAGVKSMMLAEKHKSLLSSDADHATDSLPNRRVFKADNRYYQLDMENGNIY